MTTDKTFRVNKKIVIRNLLPFLIFLMLAVLVFLNDFNNIPKTIISNEFWLWVLAILGLGVILSAWSILYERIEFKRDKIINYFNWKEVGEIANFDFVQKKKTIYYNSLGFELKEPKGNVRRFLLPYGHYDPKTLQSIMQEILRINPNIRLEDDFSKEVLAGTYKSRIYG